MNRFWANPQALWLLALVPVVLALAAWAQRRRRRDLARLASVPALAALVSARPWRRRGRQLCWLLALLVVIAGIAGPRWGRDAEQPVVQGRDLMVVLDLSRSMLAEQPNRQELARRALDDLADSLEKRGGHRIGLVVFAAQPKLVVPLTHDYDHFREAVSHQDAAALPPELRPRGEEAPSGTRIGAALKRALEGLGDGAAGFQDILLVSDGDDPAGDEEWAGGAEEARRKGVPVFTLGVGDPETPSRIPGLEFDGKPVPTRLEEKPLQEMARRTKGTYLAARRQPLAEETLYRAVLESQRPGQLAVAALPAPRLQYHWFFGGALMLLALGLLLGDRRRFPRNGPARRPFDQPAAQARGSASPRLRVGLVMIALILVSAAPQLRDPEALIREGNAAFACDDYEAALSAFEQAEERTSDPGLVAFNKAAALFRLKRFREAELSYLRALEDKAMPDARRARAWHDLGTTLINLAGGRDAALLQHAIDCFTHCLGELATNAELRDSAEHNLELARLQWLQALANPQGPDGNKEQNPDKPPPRDNGNDAKNDQGPGKQTSKGMKDGKASDPKGNNEAATETQETTPGKNKDLRTLPDSDALQPLDPTDAIAHLERAAQRIQHDQRAHTQVAPRLPPNVKDW